MPPKPFPYPLGVGIDICHIPRIRRLITKDNGKYLDQFARRIFNSYEWEHFQVKLEDAKNASHKDYMDGIAQWLAGRFAAKEAAFKAVSSRRLRFHDIIICGSNALSSKSDNVRMSRAPCALICSPLDRSSSSPKKKSLSVSSSEGIRGTEEDNGSVGFMREKGVEEMEDYEIAQLSISHDGDYATAVVIAVNDASKA
ncbi:MAG: hypothetical protein M1827_004654 [Pycnora praestabilis]|nr:MAG: hypothetical protein M1827_004654 [Pycnora praestabilis]